jgi:hypothetical protein
VPQPPRFCLAAWGLALAALAAGLGPASASRLAEPPAEPGLGARIEWLALAISEEGPAGAQAPSLTASPSPRRGFTLHQAAQPCPAHRLCSEGLRTANPERQAAALREAQAAAVELLLRQLEGWAPGVDSRAARYHLTLDPQLLAKPPPEKSFRLFEAAAHTNESARARWYDARNATWLSEDPLRDVDSPNIYAFVGWAPSMWTDPLGQMGLPAPVTPPPAAPPPPPAFVLIQGGAGTAATAGATAAGGLTVGGLVAAGSTGLATYGLTRLANWVSGGRIDERVTGRMANNLLVLWGRGDAVNIDDPAVRGTLAPGNLPPGVLIAKGYRAIYDLDGKILGWLPPPNEISGTVGDADVALRAWATDGSLPIDPATGKVGHHTIPKYMGGRSDQQLAFVDPPLHQGFHEFLDNWRLPQGVTPRSPAPRSFGGPVRPWGRENAFLPEFASESAANRQFIVDSLRDAYAHYGIYGQIREVFEREADIFIGGGQ